MREGRVLQRGPVEDLIHRPADPFVTEFLQAQRPPRALAELAGS
jgi:osmoprotectant transport system ATP-binding protein